MTSQSSSKMNEDVGPAVELDILRFELFPDYLLDSTHHEYKTYHKVPALGLFLKLEQAK